MKLVWRPERKAGSAWAPSGDLRSLRNHPKRGARVIVAESTDGAKHKGEQEESRAELEQVGRRPELPGQGSTSNDG